MRVVGVVMAAEMRVLVVVAVADVRMRWRGEVMKWLTNVVVPWVKSLAGPASHSCDIPFETMKTKVRTSRSHISYLIVRMGSGG